MKDLKEQTYYELLEIPPEASQEEILKAYNRARATYGPSSPALYSLFNKEEAQELMRLIDEAYSVLSNQFRRKQYDKGEINPQPTSQKIQEPEPTNDIKAIPEPVVTDMPSDFAIPMTEHAAQSTVVTESTVNSNGEVLKILHKQSPGDLAQADYGKTRFGRYKVDANFEEEIKKTEVFTGAVLQKIRVYKNINLDQISEVTKISRPYLMALETNSYSSLPAPVFVRGFVVQIAKALEVDPKKASTSYLSQMTGAPGK